VAGSCDQRQQAVERRNKKHNQHCPCYCLYSFKRAVFFGHKVHFWPVQHLGVFAFHNFIAKVAVMLISTSVANSADESMAKPSRIKRSWLLVRFARCCAVFEALALVMAFFLTVFTDKQAVTVAAFGVTAAQFGGWACLAFAAYWVCKHVGVF
jgi:hypothetical protein